MPLPNKATGNRGAACSLAHFPWQGLRLKNATGLLIKKAGGGLKRQKPALVQFEIIFSLAGTVPHSGQRSGVAQRS